MKYFNRYTLSISILLLAVVFSPDSGVSRATSATHDFAHAPIFGCVALLLLNWFKSLPLARSWSITKQYFVAFLIAVLFGLATEAAQSFVSREASWIDCRSDALGAAAFCGLFMILDRRIANMQIKVTGVAAAVAMLTWHSIPFVTVMSAYRHRDADFPLLLDARDNARDEFAAGQYSQTDYVRVPTLFARVPEEQALRVRFGSAEWVGLDLDEPYPDWTGYHTLAFDLINPSDAPLHLSIRIHDRRHNWQLSDRFTRKFTLAPRARTIYTVPLADVERGPRTRRLDMDHIANLLLFTTGADAGREIYVSRIWLE